jgi:D-serine deaminase-like pyridoxal phosphate-dependent protein
MYARCTACDWPAVVVTDDQARDEVAVLGAYAAAHGIEHRPDLEEFYKCHRCTNRKFVETQLGRHEQGVTLQPVAASRVSTLKLFDLTANGSRARPLAGE